MGIWNLSLNKPIYIGFLVLEISKLWMYHFHYDKMLNWFSNISLKFTDTPCFTPSRIWMSVQR